MPSDIPVSTDATQWPEPIAVLSLACSFPRASTPAEFIATMEKCEDIRTGPPNKRWGTRIRQDTGFKGTYLENIEYFDHGYFGLSENEAGELDAQQRIAVQVCHEALMNAGYYTAATPENEREGKRSAEDAACFVGVANADGATLTFQTPPSPYSLVGCLPFGTANRVSFLLGLKGASMTLDTGCSSGLYAVHMACNGLMNGDGEVAVVSGSTVFTNPNMYAQLAAVGVLSPRYMTSALDPAADGYVRGEGCGAVVLKRLSHALRDGDPIAAVIRGSALGHNGRGRLIAAPSVDGQIAVIKEALAKAGISPDEVGYLEAHATGTVAGDRKELETIGKVFGGRKDKLVIGTVKSMFGHAEGAAGIMGLIKTIMVLRNGQAPPNLNFTTLRPDARVDPAILSLPCKATGSVPVEKTIGGVNSFGAGGTNAHAVVEAWTGAGSEKVVVDRVHSYPNMKYLPFACATKPYYISPQMRALELPAEERSTAKARFGEIDV